MYEEFVSCVREHGIPLERAIPHFSTFTANALRLTSKGRVREGSDADLVALRKGSLEIVHVVARGKVLLRDGRVVAQAREEAA
jgi:beta-aspartyl-dipeptidase (metallo-type)